MSDRELLLDIQHKVDTLFKAFFGNGGDPRESLSGRVQTLEDTGKAQRKFFYILTTIAVTVAAIGAVLVAAVK